MVTVFQDQSGLAQGIGQAGNVLSNVLQQYAQQGQQRQEAQSLQNVLGNIPENATMMDLIKSYGQVPPSARQDFATLMNAYQKSQVQSSEEMGDPKMAIENMLEHVGSTGPIAALSIPFNPQVRSKRQYFDSLSLELEKRGAAMVGKGTLNKERFKFLKSTLPSASKTQAQNIGALKAWSDALQIDVPQLNEAMQNMPSSGKSDTISASFEAETPKGKIEVSDKIPEGKIYSNPKTGERIQWIKGKWRKL